MDARQQAPAARPPLWATLVATALGAGLAPVAPGTFGTAVAVPLAFGLDRLGPIAFYGGTALVIVIGIVAADVYCKATGRHDNQQVVIDEVAGYLVTLAAVPRSPVALAVGFALFRLFDIWKPPPVRWIDRRVGGGFGVVADDLGAGVYAGACLWALHHFGVLARLGG